MNQVAVRPTRVDEYRVQVLPPEKAAELWQSMPSHIKPAVFERNLMNALMANPSLMEFDPRLVYREVVKAAALGLLLDPLLGEGYIVTAYNYKAKRTEPQLRVGYKGMNKLARQTGHVAGIYAHEVHALDDVECDLGFPKVFHHRPKLFSDRGPIVGYVALVTFKDGTFDFEPMSVEQCQGIRNRSDAWKAFKDGKIKSTPWSTDEEEMSKKTVLRRLMKRQEQSPELVRATQIEDEAEGYLDRVEPVAPLRVPSPNEVEQIDDHGSDKYRPGDTVQVDGEVLPPEKEDSISSGPQTVKEKPKAPPKKKKGDAPDINDDYDSWISWAMDKVRNAPDGGQLEAFWESEVAPNEKALFPPDWNDITDAYGNRHEQFKAEREQ